jgi:hypothetical protein
MSLHIADFCTKRENVLPYCNRCSRKLKNPKAPKIFKDKIRMLEQVEGTKAKHIGQEVIILCKDKNAHGISLN